MQFISIFSFIDCVEFNLKRVLIQHNQICIPANIGDVPCTSSYVSFCAYIIDYVMSVILFNVDMTSLVRSLCCSCPLFENSTLSMLLGSGASGSAM